MPWGNRGHGNWSGAGPYSNLPPWQRPGWIYGRGACWQPYGPYPASSAKKPEEEATFLSEQKTLLEQQVKALQERLNQIQERLNGLNK